MSLQTIVVAVIVLLIAAILIYMTSGALRGVGDTAGACTDRGGECRSECTSGLQPYRLGDSECENMGGGRCCIDPSELGGG